VTKDYVIAHHEYTRIFDFIYIYEEAHKETFEKLHIELTRNV